MGMLERVFGDRMSFLTSTSSDQGRDAGIWQPWYHLALIWKRSLYCAFVDLERSYGCVPEVTSVGLERGWCMGEWCLQWWWCVMGMLWLWFGLVVMTVLEWRWDFFGNRCWVHCSLWKWWMLFLRVCGVPWRLISTNDLVQVAEGGAKLEQKLLRWKNEV